jgi:hypothetical protein
VAAGLAFAGLGATPLSISVLPPAVRDELVFRRQKPYWIAAGVAAALILAVSLIGGYRDFHRKEERLNQQRSVLRQRQRLAAEIEGIKKKNEHIRRLSDPVRNLLEAGPFMRDLLTLLSESKSPDDWLTMISDAESYFAGGTETASASKPGMRDPRRKPKTVQGPTTNEAGIYNVVIYGYTPTSNLSTVKEMIAKLNSAAFVESADLMSDDKLVDPIQSLRRPGRPTSQPFVIDVKVDIP